MLKLTMMAAVVALNLSSGANQGANEHGHDTYNLQLVDNNPFSGAGSISIVLKHEAFDAQQTPVPYAAIWDNPLRQTAQQYVAILSLLQSPIPSDLDVLLRVHRDYLRARDRQLIEDMFQRWK